MAGGVALAQEVITRRAPPVKADDPVWTQDRRRLLRVVGAVVMTMWVVGLVVFSSVLYNRNILTVDFGTYNQAWTLIGQGHLDPIRTLYINSAFIRSDFELILWPLALLHLVYPQPIVLLWVQDIAIAATGFVAYLWIIEYLERRKVSWRTSAGIAAVVLLALIVNPAVYQTLLFDVHLEPISTLFVVLAGRDLWNGRHRRAWLWVGVVLLCGTFGAITIIGLGISALLAGQSTRRQGMLLVAAALVWLGLISAIGANLGSDLDYYAYLAGRTTLPKSSGVILVAVGSLTHPSRVIDMLHARLHYIYTLIKPVGVIGLASAWGFGVPFVVLVTNALNSQYVFIFQAFQNSAVFPFILLGSVIVLVWFAQRFRFGWIPTLVIAVALIAQAANYGYRTSPGNISWAVSRIGAAPAAQLNKALSLTPPMAEVVATIGITGRFAGRPSIYFYSPNGPIPVKAAPVIFVFDPAYEDTIPNVTPADDEAAIAFVRDQLHARVLVNAAGITALSWHPPSRINHVVIPGAPPRR